MGQYVRVASVDEVPEGAMKAVEASSERFVLVHAKDGFFAVADACSHDSGPIVDGRIRGNEIMCTRHGARFDLRTGAVTAPPAIVPIDTYKVKVEGNDIFVYLE